MSLAVSVHFKMKGSTLMKRLKQIAAPMLVALAIVAFGYSGLLSGCAAGKGQLNPVTGVYDASAQASTVVVTAEKTRETALEAFDLLMQVEYPLNASGKSPPALHQFAEDIRRNGQKYLDDLTAAKVAYQTARTPDKLSALNSALASVQSILTSALKHYTTATAIK